MGGGLLPDRQHHCRAGLWTARRLFWPAAHDARRAGPVHDRLAPVRARPQHRVPDRDARAAGLWRRRIDDAVASADRRNIPAARARPLSGLPRRRGGQLQHLRPGRRRLPDPGFWMAIDLPRQPAARAPCRSAGAASQGAAERPSADHVRYAGFGVVRDVRVPGDPRSAAGSANGRAHAAGRARPLGVRPVCARSSALAGEAQRLSAHSAAPRSGSRRCGGATRWRPVMAQRWSR